MAAPLTTDPRTVEILGAERFRLITALYFTQYLGVGFLTIGLIWPLKVLWAPLVGLGVVRLRA
ncbi:hypothetical protein ASG73_00600 [Janibacter sp. Soil728]|uniref:hypothetical protein n=1 Tax=Janibacter sp. Soil728 TaxID=1736393 RepID=UPI0006F61FEB|nr:hypothetical protein [Janibacter sp. Soil728]KRE38904.1 hypothetical protein ASG73_00600 [Janibacter sp. Soil728]